ncbi:STAS domain-containing protein [Thalassoglobus polymorphus]|uniref:STAS domain-containing protein n=1 Tax=Thalassoglobus polymorphus TaxID=2527994 RepID=A0A517QTE9_9PLAN|nr:STAS domain-containing protein [Thalassoglobus polymorphus]QDT34914.1 hypothetical protein Mal48_41870 [Thalassoglobus polymorphus]
MNEPTPILEVYQVGPTTIVGFGGRDVLDNVNVAVCRKEILELIENVECETLAFDLTGVTLLPSGLLGLLTSITQQAVNVQLYNPSDDIQEVLETTRLNTLMEVKMVEIPKVDD